MAVVRVYMPTYRRARLLRRALRSLLDQSRSDWIAEVHNDDPSDPIPGDIVRAQGDPRICLVQHERNLGGTATFNLFFRRCSEPYMAILEDDNWWEPDFLEEMVVALDARPALNVAWSNMKIWREELDGSWTDMKRLVWPEESGGASPREIEWGHPRQAFAALHSNGSMLARTAHADDWRIPLVDFSMIEPFRERTFPHPMLYVPRPLVNFAQTLSSHRAHDPGTWGALQALLVASFARHVATDASRVGELWDYARSGSPSAASAVLLASFQDGNLATLRAPARAHEWMRLLISTIRHPRASWRVMGARRRNREMWEFLVRHTADRFSRDASRI
jgi:glycosyltransferase involved in cell wall biosynthesis